MNDTAARLASGGSAEYGTVQESCRRLSLSLTLSSRVATAVVADVISTDTCTHTDKNKWHTDTLVNIKISYLLRKEKWNILQN